MKIDFSKVIFTDKFKWHLMDLMYEPKSGFYPIQTFLWLQGSGSVIIRAIIVNQTIIKPFKIDEGVKLNSAN